MATILAIETSCDETSVAVVDDARHVRANMIATQFDVHAKYGGVVPELASRAHLERIDAMVLEALERAVCRPDDIDAIAVTRAPGLIGSLLIGVTAAKTLAWLWGKPLIGVNHIHAHATSAAITSDTPPWPAIALVVSGGHTSLYHVRDFHEIELLGCTIDDAAGEAFDKVAAILQIGFPGGPLVDKRAQNGNPAAYAFPRSMLAKGSLDFSFSGLKTAVLYQIHGSGKTSGGLEKLSERDVADICASFSAAVVDVLVEKTMRAVRAAGVARVVVGGGVAANSFLRKALSDRCEAEGVVLHLTPMSYCTDNAAMIAALGDRLYAMGRRDSLDMPAKAGEPAD